MEPIILFLTWRWEEDHRLCMVGQNFRDQELVSPLSWACVVTTLQPCCTLMLMPIAVVEMDIHACVHVGWVKLTPPPQQEACLLIFFWSPRG